MRLPATLARFLGLLPDDEGLAFTPPPLAPPNISYTTPVARTTADTVSLSVTNSGGACTDYAVEPGSADDPADFGLTLNPTTGKFTGTPDAVGTFVVTVLATNGAGTDTADVTFIITAPAPHSGGQRGGRKRGRNIR